MTIMVTRTRACYFIYALPVLCEDAFCVKLRSVHLPLLLNYFLVFFYCACGGGNVACMGLLKHPH